MFSRNKRWGAQLPGGACGKAPVTFLTCYHTSPQSTPLSFKGVKCPEFTIIILFKIVFVNIFSALSELPSGCPVLNSKQKLRCPWLCRAAGGSGPCSGDTCSPVSRDIQEQKPIGAGCESIRRLESPRALRAGVKHPVFPAHLLSHPQSCQPRAPHLSRNPNKLQTKPGPAPHLMLR